MKGRYGKELLRMLSDANHAVEQDSQRETDDPISEDASETIYIYRIT